jgi:signal transduction histidine kinase/ActR/RegA family two-component response regulator
MDALTTDATRRDFEHRVVRPDGQVRWLSVRAKSERDDTGAVCRVTALHIDVTQQKHTTEAQLHSQKLEALGTLAGGIAHDFNNILQAISGNTTLALLGVQGNHRVRGFLDEVTIAAARASDLVRQILAFSRPDVQPPRAISLADAVGEALKLVRATLPATIAIHTDLDPRAPLVAADASKIHQVVVNLATNAAHAVSAAGGAIDVKLQAITLARGATPLAPELPAGSYVALHVHDNGCGIAPSSLPRIFDPFYTTKSVGQGTGLGLSVVHGIVKSLGGAVTVRSELGVGSTFSVYLPGLSVEALETEQNAREMAVPALAGGERVLFVDDERMLVTLGVGILRMLGLRPTGFTDPVAALAALEAAPDQFDVLVTDAAMPVLSGYELSERALALRADLPVIMVSGYVGPDELVHAEQLGVRELLLKPVSIDELHRALARALRGQRHSVRALSRA